MTGSTEASSYQRLREDLAYLRLTTAAEQLSAECHRSPKPRGHPVDFCTFWPAVPEPGQEADEIEFNRLPEIGRGGPGFSAGAGVGPEMPKIRTRSAANSGRHRKSAKVHTSGLAG